MPDEYKPYLYISAVNKEYFNELHLISGRFAENDNELVIAINNKNIINAPFFILHSSFYTCYFYIYSIII